MATSTVESELPLVLEVVATDDTLTVKLDDGRTLSVPLAWYPRLVHGSTEERNDWRVIGRGHGIHWERLDEDINIENLIAGRPSGESQTSLARWFEGRASIRSK